MPSKSAIVFCDGACAGNQNSRNIGGWGAFIQLGDKTITLYGGESDTTNNRMELTACIKSLEELEDAGVPVEINSDSAYLVNCIKDRWYVRWRENGWQNSKKQPVENQDLWKTLLALVEKMPVTFKKVKGHAGVELNEMADGLANRGMAEFPAGGENRIVDEDGEDPEPEEGYRLLKVPGGYLVRLYRGFQVMETLKKVLKAKKITAGSIQGIGALEDIELGYYHLDKKEYSRKTLSGTWELVSWMGNISYLDSQPFIHAHAVLSDAEMNTRGGHFFEALVAVTLEAYIVTAPEEIIRLHDEETGLFLMKL